MYTSCSAIPYNTCCNWFMQISYTMPVEIWNAIAFLMSGESPTATSDVQQFLKFGFLSHTVCSSTNFPDQEIESKITTVSNEPIYGLPFHWWSTCLCEWLQTGPISHMYYTWTRKKIHKILILQVCHLLIRLLLFIICCNFIHTSLPG